jgi:hypothetical protein
MSDLADRSELGTLMAVLPSLAVLPILLAIGGEKIAGAKGLPL